MNKHIIEHFQKEDNILYSVLENIDKLGKLKPADPEDYFVNLCREIVYQQLSDKAGDTIYFKISEYPASKGRDERI